MIREMLIGLGVTNALALTIAGKTIELAAAPHAGVPDGVLLVPRDVAWPEGAAQGATGAVAAHAMS